MELVRWALVGQVVVDLPISPEQMARQIPEAVVVAVGLILPRQ
jgi:hypothetical protein